MGTCGCGSSCGCAPTSVQLDHLGGPLGLEPRRSSPGRLDVTVNRGRAPDLGLDRRPKRAPTGPTDPLAHRAAPGRAGGQVPRDRRGDGMACGNPDSDADAESGSDVLGTTLQPSSPLRPGPTARPVATLLVPGFAIHVPAGGNLLDAVPAALRDARSGGAQRGTLMRHKRYSAGGPGELSALRATPHHRAGPGCSGEAIAHFGRPGSLPQPPDPMDPPPPPQGGLGGEDIGPDWLFFSYRTLNLRLPHDWIWEYLVDWADLYYPDSDPHFEVQSDASNGLVSSVSDALDLLWLPFRIAARGSPATFHSLLGCWNLPQDFKDDACFWKNGWGAAHKVYLYACQLLYTYVDHVTASDLQECEGIADFIRTGLSGGTVHNQVGGPTCRVTLNLRNADTAEAHRVGESCAYGDEACDVGFLVSRDHNGNIGLFYRPNGKDFDDYDLVLVYDSLNCYGDRANSEGDCLAPEDKAGANTDSYALTKGGASQSYDIVFPPVHLDFRGEVCDRLLFFGRMAFDYSRGGAETIDELLEYERVAEQFGRYALRHIVAMSGTMAHEFGHAFLGRHGHCDWHCCMDIAAHRFLCKVRGELGLPADSDATFAAAPVDDDWDPDVHTSRRYEANCSSDKVSGWPAFTVWSCDVGEGNNGVAWTEADYCSSTFCFSGVEGGEFSWDSHLPADPDTHCVVP